MSYWRKYLTLLDKKRLELKALNDLAVWEGLEHEQVQVLQAEVALLEEFVQVLDRLELGD